LTIESLPIFYSRYWGLFTQPHQQDDPDFNWRDDILGVGYSGHQSVLNNPALQNEHATGCLPAGLYTITSTDDEKGPLTHHLTPDPANVMYGRSGFLIHGDTTPADHTASDGCIVAPHWTREIFEVGDVITVV
jgi:hypothetical protein